MKKTVENHSEGEEFEEDVDEPEEVDEENNAGSDKGSRRSSRLRTTPNKKMKYTSSDEEDLDDEEADEDFDEEEYAERKTRKKPGPKSKQKAAPASKKKAAPKPKSEEEEDEEDEDEEDDEDEEEDEDDESNDASEKSMNSNNPADKDYVSGAFLVSKSDLADKDNDPPLWRIDGKALLQKYIPFKDDEGKTLYRNTYTYSGWSINNKNNYYPASIVFKQQSQKEHVVEFQRDLLPKEEENDD